MVSVGHLSTQSSSLPGPHPQDTLTFPFTSHGQTLLSLGSLITNHSIATNTQNFFKRKSQYAHLRGPIFYLQRLQLNTKLATKAHHTLITQLSWLCFSHPPVHVCSSLPFIFAFPPPPPLSIHLSGNLKAFLIAREIDVTTQLVSPLCSGGRASSFSECGHQNLAELSRMKGHLHLHICFLTAMHPDIRWVYRSQVEHLCSAKSSRPKPQESHGCECRNPTRGEEAPFNFLNVSPIYYQSKVNSPATV